MAPDAVPTGSRKSFALGALGLALPAFFVVLHLLGLPTKLRYPGELNFIEGIPLVEMIHLREGIPIYANPSPAGFDSTNYGPLYYLAGSQLVDPERPSFAALRLFSLAGTLLTALLAALLAYRLSSSRLAAAMTVLLFLSYAFVIRHAASVRSDLIAVALVFAGFLVAHRMRDRRAVLWAVPLMVAGFYYKPQFVAAPVAVFFFLLWERRFRLAAQFGGCMTASVLAALAIFQFVVFRGQAFFYHFILYNLLPFKSESLLSGLGFFALILTVPLLVSLEYLKTNTDRLLFSYLACSYGLALATVGRAGSDTNFFLECALISSVLFSALLASRLAEPARVPELLVLLLVALFVGQWFRTPAPAAKDIEADANVQGMLKRFPRGTTALTYYSGDAVRAGLRLPFSNVFHYTHLVRQGVAEKHDMLDLIAQHRFGLILIDFDMESEQSDYFLNYYLTSEMREAIRAHYRLSDTIEMPGPEKLRDEAKFYVWVPRLNDAGGVSPAQPVQ